MAGKNTIPHSRRKSGKKAHKKALKRQEAEARQAHYDSLSEEEKKAQREKNRQRYLKQIGA